ncbi:olfactory receptor 6N1-like [Amia ocellicauda]|uniref:olfactory receptor 6N1-like n=1 Tax=Amia ocellicauda TaxID=2972642 RepID=UPI0034642841
MTRARPLKPPADQCFQEFVIAGGDLSLVNFYAEISVALLMLYIVVIVGNLMIIVLVVTDQRLHKPMYFFLINLSFIDIVITTAVIPQMLAVFITGNGVISYMGCFSQMYFYLAFESIESFLLTVMAYDRYVAICNPLRYSAIITNKKCAVLTICAWILGLCGPIANVILASLLPFCKQYKIAYWYCDYPPVVTLACIDTTFEIDLALGIALLSAFASHWSERLQLVEDAAPVWRTLYKPPSQWQVLHGIVATGQYVHRVDPAANKMQSVQDELSRREMLEKPSPVWRVGELTQFDAQVRFCR